MHFAVALGLLASAAGPALADSYGNFFRIPCAGRLVDERADPIISPGVVSQHVHEIAGGNAFNFTTTYNTTQQSSCSSCPVKKDLSNYWTPKLYWQAPNGSFFDVPRLGEGLGKRAGMTVYYYNRAQDGQDHVQAFPEGFRMIAGDPFKRSNPGFGGSNGSANAINWQCLHNDYHEPATANLPHKNCDYALRAAIYFPSCWNNQTVDSPDHSSHMAYPVGPNFDNGKCPASHPVKLVNIFYEVDYVMNTLLDESGNFEGKLVLAQGDDTGYGLHGDFVNGWDVPYLQEKIESCNAGDDEDALPGCFGELFTDDQQHQCTIPAMVDEPVSGELKALPGDNPIQGGPGDATIIPTKELKIPTTPPPIDFKDMTSKGWSYQGCASDTGSSRSLSGSSNSDDNMTVEACIDYCSGKGYSLAGIEYGNQCYCDNSIPQDQAPVKGEWGGCSMPCAGDASEICGAGDALSLYKKCDGGACTNAGFELGTPVPATDGGSTSTKVRRSHLARHRRALRHAQVTS